MATGADVLSMLLPNGGWIIVEDDFDGITWIDERPRCTKVEFEAGFAQYDAWKIEQDNAKEATKSSALAKLSALGLTEDEVRSITGGN